MTLSLHLNYIFRLMSFISVFVESIQEDEFSSKPQVWTTSKKMQHNVELFLSSELGHSPKRSAKLLGREQRNDFRHNPTTPLSEGMWVYLWVCRFQFRIRKGLVSTGSNFPVWVTMHQELWKLCPCKFLIMGVKCTTFMAKRLQASFSYSTYFVAFPKPKVI